MATLPSRALAALVLALVALLAGAPVARATPLTLPLFGSLNTQMIVVKIDPASGLRIETLTRVFGLTVEKRVLASRGIYLVRPADTWAQDAIWLTWVALRLTFYPGVVYAEVNEPVELSGTRFHGWPDGLPRDVSDDVSRYDSQYADDVLQLAAIRQQTTGRGARVAVLDTGADFSHPALQGRVVPGWNYIDDNADVADVAGGVDADADGVVDAAYGHGTFMAGLVSKVAPGAELRIYKVLNSDGYGSYYEVAQAILDATRDGAQVISLSLGTTKQTTSRVLSDAVEQARRAGVLVVAAAGNTADTTKEYPAAQSGVLAVSALNADCTQLASFSDRGDWTLVAAPGEGVVGPLPDGRYGSWAGTSMATSLVAGQAALLIEAKPGVRQDLLYRAITETAKPLGRGTVRYGSVDLARSISWLTARR